MATQNSVNIGDSARCFTGVYAWGGAGAYFDDTTLGSFTVSRAGTGFILGKPVAWAGGQTITGLTAGNCYYICMDSAGLIYKTTDEAIAYGGTVMPLFECLRDSTSPANNQVTVREDHPYNMPYLVNHYLHDSIGPIIENKSKGANITLNGTQKIQINGADTLLDHGLSTTIPDSGGVAVSFNKEYTNGSGMWALQNATDTFSGYYNNAGTVTALGGSKFGVYTLYVGKDNLNSATPVYFAVLDTSQYNTQGLADTAIGNGTTAQATNELAALELCKLGYIIFGQAANAIVQVIIAKSTFQSSVTTTGSNAASLINTSTTSFNGILSSADTNVQAALDTIDNWGASTTDHAVLIGNGTGSAIGSLAVGATGEILTGVTGADPTWSSSPTMANLTLSTGGAVRTNTTAGNTLLFQAYDVDGTAYVTFATLTANNTPTFDLDAAVTIGTNYIYRVGGTDVSVSDGGTGASTLTDHGVLLGSGTAAITALGEASNGQLVIGSTGNDPVLATLTAGTNMTVTNASGSITLSQTLVALNDQTDSYTLVLGDAGKLITMTKASANTLTLPKNASVAFPVGTYVLIYQGGAGQTTVSPVDGDVTLHATDSLYSLYGIYSLAAAVKIATDTWVLFGDLA